MEVHVGKRIVICFSPAVAHCCTISVQQMPLDLMMSSNVARYLPLACHSVRPSLQQGLVSTPGGSVWSQGFVSAALTRSVACVKMGCTSQSKAGVWACTGAINVVAPLEQSLLSCMAWHGVATPCFLVIARFLKVSRWRTRAWRAYATCWQGAAADWGF